jgi:hypothetical protein
VRISHFQGGEYSIGTLLIAPLLPFKKSMIKQLQQRGFSTDQMTFRNIVALYYNEFVSNKENARSTFVPISTYEFRNNVAFRLFPSDSFEVTAKNRHNFTEIEDVTDNIIGLFKMAKLKKRNAGLGSYEPSSVLTQEEMMMANHAEAVEAALEQKAFDNRMFRWGDLKGLFLTVIVIWFLIYLVSE